MEHIKPPRTLQLTGNIANTWKVWRQAFELFITATEADKKTEKVKCALFLHIAGEEAVELYNTFQISEDDNTLSNLYARFEKHCIPKRNVTFERHKFNMRNQGVSESIDQYVTELRTLAKPCEFGELLESLIRDRIVCGITSDTVRERLLRDTELTLSKALDICKAAEMTKEQLKKINESEHSNATVLEVRESGKENKQDRNSKPLNFRAKKQYPKQKKSFEGRRSCLRCDTKHAYRQCPAFGSKCHNCGKLNHYSKCCLMKSVHEIEGSNAENSPNIDRLYIGSVQTLDCEKELRSWYVPLEIGKQVVSFKIDTGAQVNTIPIDLAERVRNNVPYQNNHTKVIGYGGNEIPIKGKLTLTVKDHGKIRKLEFYVVKHNNVEPILGLPTCQTMGIVSLMRELQKDKDSESYDNLMKEFEDVFKGIGTIDVQYNIQLEQGHSPRICKARRVPLTLLPTLKRELEMMTKNGVIAEVTEPTDWVNPITLVEKPGGAIRICLDPTELNKAIKREHYPMSSVEEIAGRMTGAKFWSTLDAQKGFWQIPLSEQSSYLTTFATPFGRYRFLKMPFGLKSAPEVFSRSMKTILEGLEGVEDFYDDLLITGSTKEEHDLRLRAVLERCRKKNLKLNKAKCQLGRNSVKYLGHIFTREGLKIDPEKVDAINKMPAPSDAKDLERFLGMVNYVSRFTPQSSILTKELRELTKKERCWQWTDAHQKSFEALKSQITQAPVLRYFDLNKEIVLQVDASKGGLGAALLQEGKPVAYASKSLSISQTRYAQIEKEMLAIVFGCERFHQYIYGKEILVESDHKPIESIIKKPIGEAPPRLQRMLLRLQNYHIHVVHKKGTEMLVADTLSRAYEKDAEEVEESEDNFKIHVHTVLTALSKDAEELAQACR